MYELYEGVCVVYVYLFKGHKHYFFVQLHVHFKNSIFQTFFDFKTFTHNFVRDGEEKLKVYYYFFIIQFNSFEEKNFIRNRNSILQSVKRFCRSVYLYLLCFYANNKRVELKTNNFQYKTQEKKMNRCRAHPYV